MAGLGFGLTYDPSHLPWLGIDPLDALEHALQAGLISHVQAKDIQIDERARTRLYTAGYNGDIAVEHEDPVWGGSLDKTMQGFQIAARTLRPLIVTEPGAQPPSMS